MGRGSLSKAARGDPENKGVKFLLPNDQGYMVMPNSQGWARPNQRVSTQRPQQSQQAPFQHQKLQQQAPPQPHQPWPSQTVVNSPGPATGRWEGPQPSRYHDSRSERDNTGAKNQEKIVDVLQLLTDKLMQGGYLGGGNKPAAQLRLPNLALPSPKRGQSSRIETKEYFLWKIALQRTIKNNSLSPDAVLALYASTPKLTTEAWSAVFQSSSTLDSALQKLDQIHPPIEHVYSQLVMQITKMPVMYQLSSKERIYQLNEMLELLEQFITFFGNSQDLKRSNALVVLTKLSESKYSNENFVKQIYIFDDAHRAGVPYCISLRNYLVEVRLLTVDLESALQIVEAEEPGATTAGFTSAATVPTATPPSRPKPEAQPQKKFKQGGGKANSSRPPRPPARCLQCPSVGQHMTYKCPKLSDVKRGALPLKPGICRKCLYDTADGAHMEECGVRRYYIDNAYILIKYTCDPHETHIAICNGPHCKNLKPKRLLDPDQEKRPSKLRSFVTRVITLANHPKERGEEDYPVAFMAEVSAIRGKDGLTLPCTLFYDSMGSRTWIKSKSGSLPNNFDWFTEPVLRRFSIKTISGEEVMDKKVHDVRLVTLKGLVSIQAVDGGLEGGLKGDDIDEDVAKRHGLNAPTTKELDATDIVIIIGCDKSSLMPLVRPTPKALLQEYPGITLADSLVTNRTLYFGPIKREASGKKIQHKGSSQERA